MASAVRAAMVRSMGGLWPAAQALSVPYMRSSGHPHSRNDHAGHLAHRLLRSSSCRCQPWFLAFYLVGQAKAGISSLELSRHLAVEYDTAWLLHNKILRAMTERDECAAPIR